MYQNSKIEMARLIVLLGIIFLFGYLSGQWFLITLLVLSGYLVWQLRQIYYLERFMSGFDPQAKESLTGIWQYVAEKSNRFQKTGRKRKRRISRLLQRFHTTLEAIPDAIVILNSTMEVEWMNAASTRLLGLTRKDIGLHINSVLSDRRFNDYIQDQNFKIPLEFLSPLNPSIELELAIINFGENQLLLTAHDISELKKIESVRREFIGNVSHELRTPLTVISGYMEMLQQEELEPEVKEAIVSTSRQADRMNQLVSDLLMLSRFELNENSALIEEPVNVTQLLLALVDDAKRLSGDNKHLISLESDEDLWMNASELELSSAFGNLIFNAVKYTPPGTEIFLRWFATDLNLVFQVEDKGSGIEAHHLARLTERFYRVDKARSRERGGTGLGLSISKHVVQRHEGEIKIESKIGEGTMFSCIFPLNRKMVSKIDSHSKKSREN